MLGFGMTGQQDLGVFQSAARRSEDEIAASGAHVYDFGCKNWERYHATMDQIMFCRPHTRSHAFGTSLRVGGPGPEIGFTRTLARSLHTTSLGRDFAIIKVALGGSPVKHWAPGGYLWELLKKTVTAAQADHNFSTAIAGHKCSVNCGLAVDPPTCIRVRGLVWYQGEHEQKWAASAPLWAHHFVRLVQGVADTVGHNDFGVVIGQTLPWVRMLQCRMNE